MYSNKQSGHSLPCPAEYFHTPCGLNTVAEPGISSCVSGSRTYAVTHNLAQWGRTWLGSEVAWVQMPACHFLPFWLADFSSLACSTNSNSTCPRCVSQCVQLLVLYFCPAHAPPRSRDSELRPLCVCSYHMSSLDERGKVSHSSASVWSRGTYVHWDVRGNSLSTVDAGTIHLHHPLSPGWTISLWV